MKHTITALKAQQRDPKRVNVFLDGEFAFGLARIVAAWLQVGQELSDEQIERLKAQDIEEVAYQRALRLLNYRPRTAAEVERRLMEQNYSAEVIRRVIERLQHNGLLDDRQFARDWAEARASLHPRSRRVIRLELRRKGVEEDTILQALEGLADEQALAYQAGIRKARQLIEAGAEWKEFRVKLGQFMARKGFSYETSMAAIHSLWADVLSEEEKEGKDRIETDKEDGRWTSEQ
jgi:regulatory protein